MSAPRLVVLSLRYSSWSMRPWLALTHAGVRFSMETAELAKMSRTAADPTADDDLRARRSKGSVSGLFPVLWVDDAPIHESLAICEWVADTHPEAGLWPDDALDRARARAVCSEMVSSFQNLRGDLSCHAFARVPGYALREETRVEVDRVFEIWSALLERHGGPFLTGRFGIPDCMYFPVVTRFRTYGVALPDPLEAYARAVEASPAVQAWRRAAAAAPRLPIYDEYVRSLGGDPDAALPS